MHWVFKSDSVHENVVFNFMHDPIDDLAVFAQGYHNAGRKLADELASAAGYSDYDGYPVLFLYRHALELYLKAFVCRGAKLVHLLDPDEMDTTELFKDHSLSRLLPGVKVVLNALDWIDEFKTLHLSSFEDFVDLVKGIDEVDKNSFAFRYPIKKDRQAAHEHHTVINVIAFAQHLDPVLKLLSGGLSGLSEEFDLAAEAKYVLQQTISCLHHMTDVNMA